jgi:hypothetical protein
MSSRKILITGIFLRVSTLGRACPTKGQVSMDFHTERNSFVCEPNHIWTNVGC